MRTPGCRQIPSILLLACAALSARVATSVQAAELVVVDQSGCPFCERFEREIAPAWANTAEGREVPLRRLGLHDEWPSDLSGVQRPNVAPTFILVESGGELGRLVGYRGDEHFWFLIGQLLEEREDVPATTDRASGPDAAER